MIFKFIRKEHISDIMELSNELVHIYLPLLIPRSNVDTLTNIAHVHSNFGLVYR